MRVSIKKVFWLVLLFGSIKSFALPGEKRTIFTSGEKVYTIRYQLGQSTVFDFGVSPETVICGNKNYFNIEKIKNGITVQPLSNFSTNLTVLVGSRRFLFFLTPAGNMKSDGFVEVRWVPPSSVQKEIKAVKEKKVVVKELKQKVHLNGSLKLVLLSEKSVGQRRIFDLELENQGAKDLETKEVFILASRRTKPLKDQILVWSQTKVKSKGKVLGRLILLEDLNKSLSLKIQFAGKSHSVLITGRRK